MRSLVERSDPCAGHERERGGVESQASFCIVGGNPVLLSVEPTKQKTRRPERRGITRAVSPKKMREEKGNVEAQERRREEDPAQRLARFEVCWPSLLDCVAV